MATLTRQQRMLFDELHNSRLEDFKTFNKKSYRGIWNSVIEKYPESAHFIYELLQNADDAEATKVYIIVNRHEMIFKHNGKKHFDVTPEDAVPVGDINSITGIGDSSKIETENKIGKFGVGFKAVFQYTDTPEIYDDYFKFKIENYIVPTLLPYDHPEREEGETLFLFPFKNEDTAYNEIIRKLENLDNPILFLRNLQKIVWRIDRKKNTIGDELSYGKALLEKEKYKDGTYLEKYKLTDSNGSRTIFLFSENIEITEENKILPISVGFFYDDKEKKLITNTQQNIFCFFPTKETFKACFISHGPFLLTDNRQNLKPNEEYNKTIIGYIAELAAHAVLHLRDYGIEHDNYLIDENLTEIIPEYKYKHSWYGNSLDEIFEEPIKQAFADILFSEEIIMSRSNTYLKLEDAYIAAPRELEGLLSQKQMSSILIYAEEDDDKKVADFMKWELSQNISRRDDDIFEDVNEFSSEYFGRSITANFMEKQDFRWVIRLYNFLRSAAPKLWKILDKNTPQYKLVFRSAPIIKTQKGQWVSAFLDSTTPNVYLPLKKKDISSDYNFVAEEYLKNERALKFFEELNIKEPDELDYIQSIILNKFRGEEFDIDNDDIISDFGVIYSYYKRIQENSKRQEFVELIKNRIYLVSVAGYLERPESMYFKIPQLESYFSYTEEVNYLDMDFYDSVVSKYEKDEITNFMALLGVHRYPKMQSLRRYNKYFVSLPTRELIRTYDISEYQIDDFVLEHFNEIIDNNIDEELSIYLWNDILPGLNFNDYGRLTYRYRRKYARTYSIDYYESSFKCDLINKPWVYNIHGELVSPKELCQEDLAPEYNRNNGLIDFLKIQKRERPIILEMGGTEEQQNDYDFGKSIKEEYGSELSEDEMRQALSKAMEEKRARQQKIQVSVQDAEDEEDESNNSNNEIEEESIESKLNKKWEKKANELITRPHSSPNMENSLPEYAQNNQEEQSVQPFFDNKSPRDRSQQSSSSNSDVEKKFKAKEEEAKEKAEKTSELLQILELLNNENKFTFKWYKLLMELMHANRTESVNRHIQIDFTEWSYICSDKILHLTNPSLPIPQWVSESESFAITSLGREPKKIEGVIVKTDDTSVDIAIERTKVLDDICANAKAIRLTAENSSNFIDSLEKRFLQLGFDDDYDMNEHLTKNIKFIYGPPGTGKTTRVVEIISDILKAPSKKTNILVLTPTNKAADVVSLKMVDDDVCYNYLTRFGATESLYLIEDAAIVSNRDQTDMDFLDHNIVVTTAARYAYDYLQPDDTFICDYPWDYIIIDEASMIDILTVTYILYRGANSNIIISGDPKQIQPVAQNDMPTYNVYDLVGLHGFADALNRYKRYPVIPLTVQHRSIDSIGRIVSKFAYDGIVQSDPNRSPQKALKLDALDISDVNFMGFDIKDFDNIYGLTAIKQSAFHVYSAIFTYNMVGYVAEQIKKKYPNSHYTIGIVCPYKAEADAIKLMLENKSLDNDCCSISCGTVHSFQGDECDIMFVVLNPPARCSSSSHINNENILNVAMSRARDYIFFVLPKDQVPGFTRKNDIGRLRDSKTSRIMYCSDVEKSIWGASNYIESNTHVTCHMPVNVYYEHLSRYDVRIADDALDIKINDNIN